MKPPKRVLMKIGDYYTLQGAAAALGLSYWSVYRYVRVAGIPTQQLSNLVLVRLADLQELGQAATRPEQRATPALGDLCPECGALALVHEEGCQKCHACGFSVC